MLCATITSSTEAITIILFIENKLRNFSFDAFVLLFIFFILDFIYILFHFIFMIGFYFATSVPCISGSVCVVYVVWLLFYYRLTRQKPHLFTFTVHTINFCAIFMFLTICRFFYNASVHFSMENCT